MGSSENNREILPVRSPKLEFEMARIIELKSKETGRRPYDLG
jgi:hypothetical protein